MKYTVEVRSSNHEYPFDARPKWNVEITRYLSCDVAIKWGYTITTLHIWDVKFAHWLWRV